MQETGQKQKAINAYQSALSIRTGYAEAHRNLSSIKKYKLEDAQINVCQVLHQKADLSDNDRCHLDFALAKMFDDIKKYDEAYHHLISGNFIRKRMLGYSLKQDRDLFIDLKEGQRGFEKLCLKDYEPVSQTIPIFILGMPRSGTTLIEQIVSSHTQVYGGGELNYVKAYGSKLAAGSITPTVEHISVFRDQYLHQLSNLAHGRIYVTDKMPHNFRYIPLIAPHFRKQK